MLPVLKSILFAVILSLIPTPTMHIKAAAELPESASAQESDHGHETAFAHYRKDMVTAVLCNNLQFIYQILCYAQTKGNDPAEIINSMKTDEGNPILHEAARHENGAMVALLLTNRANPNIAKTEDPHKGKVALHSAANQGSHEAVIQLLMHGADTEVTFAPYEQTPLFIAVIARKNKAAASLLRGRANPNVRDKNGNTPLHHAAIKNDPSLIEMLLEHGAALNIYNNDGYLPNNVATTCARQAIYNYLRLGGARERNANIVSASEKAPHDNGLCESDYESKSH